MKINFLKFLPLFAALLLAIPSCKDDDEEDEQTSEVAVSSVALDKTTLEITIGETVTLKATVSPENATDKTVKWTSSDESIAKVDSKGVVTAVKEGSVKITATAEKYSTQTASCTITVKAATPSKVLVTSIVLNKTATEITVGSDETLTVSSVLPEDATDKTYTWSSADEEIATVDENGKVTAVAAGTVKITATANDGSEVKAECEVTVKAILVETITLNKTTTEITVGSVETLTVSSVLPEDANDKTYTWSSSDETIASVDAEGKVTAVAAGTATITAMANDGSGVKAECEVTVVMTADIINIEINYHNNIFITELNFKFYSESGTYEYTGGRMFADRGATLTKNGTTLTLAVKPDGSDSDNYTITINTANNTYTVNNTSTYGTLISIKSWKVNGTDISSQWTRQ